MAILKFGEKKRKKNWVGKKSTKKRPNGRKQNNL